MTPQETISVIIPCYKAEKTIERAIDSIMSQQYPCYEIIAVDDGSPDQTGTVLDELANSCPVLQVIHQKNGGVSSARNAGIRRASGKWMFFLDCDDFITPDAFSKLIEISDHADICCGAYEIVTDDGHREKHTCASGDRQTIYESLIRGDSALNSMCARLYRTEMIQSKHLLVPEGIAIGEDVLFNLEAFSAASHWEMMDDSIYQYNLGGNSAMMNAETRFFDSNQAMIRGILDFTRRNHLETQLFRAVLDIYLRALRRDYGKAGAAIRFTSQMVKEISQGVKREQLPGKQKLYLDAIRICPAASVLIP